MVTQPKFQTADHPLSPFLLNAGFYPSALGFMMRRPPSAATSPAPVDRFEETPAGPGIQDEDVFAEADALPRRRSSPPARSTARLARAPVNPRRGDDGA